MTTYLFTGKNQTPCDPPQIMEFFGCLTMAYLLAFVLYLVCEAPVSRLEKLAFEGRPQLPRREATKPTAEGNVEVVRL